MLWSNRGRVGIWLQVVFVELWKSFGVIVATCKHGNCGEPWVKPTSLIHNLPVGHLMDNEELALKLHDPTFVLHCKVNYQGTLVWKT